MNWITWGKVSAANSSAVLQVLELSSLTRSVWPLALFVVSQVAVSFWTMVAAMPVEAPRVTPPEIYI